MAFAAGALALFAGAAAAQPIARVYVVIVHPDNPTRSVSRSFLADAFLKRITRWPDGESIRPIDLGVSSPIRQRFTQEMLGRSVPAVRSYWQQIIFTGRGVPPVELPNDASVVAYVAGHRGAVGYVSSTANLGRARALAVQ